MQLDLDGMIQVGRDGVMWQSTKDGWVRKDEGIARTLAAEHETWKDRCLSLLANYALLAKRPFSLDEFRSAWTELGYPEPHSPAVWGAITNSAKRRRLIRPTGQWVQSKRPSAHARTCQLWEAC